MPLEVELRGSGDLTLRIEPAGGSCQGQVLGEGPTLRGKWMSTSPAG